MARKKKTVVHSKKLRSAKRSKSIVLYRLGYSGIFIAFLLVILIFGGLALPNVIISSLAGIFVFISGIITVGRYLEDRPNISVTINYDDSSRIVQPNPDDAYEPRGTSFRVSLNIYADSNKPVSIRQIFLSETVGSTKNTLNSRRGGAVNIRGHNSKNLLLHFSSENILASSLELVVIYAKDKEKRIKLDLEKLDKRRK